MKNKVDFDNYTKNYEQLLKNQLSFFSDDREYFSDCKTKIASNYCSSVDTKNILDFGSGIGLSLSSLTVHFPDSKIFVTDLSKKSLNYVKKKYSKVTVVDDSSLNKFKFDLIFISGVFHHIPNDNRMNVLYRLESILSLNGKIIIFEHNPLNPITRRMVSTCPFDEDAELISLRKMNNMIQTTNIFNIISSGYYLFFPQMLKFLRPFEKIMTNIPLGGQYFTVAQKLNINYKTTSF